jgi:hypothetical protein
MGRRIAACCHRVTDGDNRVQYQRREVMKTKKTLAQCAEETLRILQKTVKKLDSPAHTKCATVFARNLRMAVAKAEQKYGN